jgi:hypothetical protein
MSALYDSAREGLLAGEIAWRTGGPTIKAHLVRGYTFSVAHRFLSDVTAANGVIVASEVLGSLTNVAGVADAADGVWENVPEGDLIPYVVIAQASAVTGGADVPATQQRLIAFIDRADGLPALPNGENVNVFWSAGADRIFRI